MPDWVWGIVVGGLLVVFGAVWARMARLSRATDEMTALLTEVMEQFSTNTGHTLKDSTNRLEAAAIAGRDAADELKKRAHDAAAVLDRLTMKADASAESSERLEVAAAVVADDLTAAHARADEAVGPHGAAADAYGQSAPKD